MATRKRTPKVTEEEEAIQRLLTAVEEIRAEQRAHYEGITQQLESLEKRVCERIDRLDRSIDRLERSLTSIAGERISADIANKTTLN